MNNLSIKTHFKIILIDETETWNHEKLVAAAGRIYTAYLLDTNRHVFLAEMRPSYELNPIYFVTENSVDEEFDEDLSSMIDSEPIYSHVASIDACLLKNPRLMHDCKSDVIHVTSEGKISKEDEYLEILNRKIDYYKSSPICFNLPSRNETSTASAPQEEFIN